MAAIDLGTNSIRLIVAEPPAADPGGAYGTVARDMVITRIGQGVDETGAIASEALARTVDVLARYCRRARALHADRIRVAATSAVRDASNRRDLDGAVRDHAGSDLEVISGEREAGLSFLGATRDLQEPPPFLVFDIGGGSTEFAVGTGRPEKAVSTRMGSVRLTERFVDRDPPTRDELRAMEDEIEARLEEAVRAVPFRTARTMVAVAGTATTLRALALGLPRYDPEAIHRTWLSLRDAERVFAELARMTTAERAALPVMASGRADVIVAGAAILVAVMCRFGFERALVSETDILDGLAIEMFGGDR